MAADPLTAATVNDLFNFDSTDDEDPFHDKSWPNGRDDKTTLSPGKRKADDDDNLGVDLGLDEEVKLIKKRKPIAKLDEARLLSAAGIPKLRALARSGKISKKLHFKGKGHEFSDVARLLNYYQLWLDNLYPRAKFADGLQLVEKAGHSKRMQVMRKEWIDEGKPGYIKEKTKKADEEREKEGDTDDLSAGDSKTSGNNWENNASVSPRVDAEGGSLFIPDSRPTRDDENNLPEDDELDALLAQQDNARAPHAPKSTSRQAMDLDSEGEDDLDALLAEQETRRGPPTASAPSDTSKSKPSPFDEDDEDPDDLDALIAEQEATSEPSTEQPRSDTQLPTVRNKVLTILDDNDRHKDVMNEDNGLDALIVEQEARQQEKIKQRSSSTRATTSPGTSTHSNTDADVQVDPDADADADADGEDMFSSSPIRTNEARSRSSNIVPGLSAPVPTRSTTDMETERGSNRKGKMADEEDSIEAEADNNDMGADDMFSSSPVQND
ncbi:uncharacterized protein Z518_08473 [Rhinocladiella mackenziei CBS 650.93]|uniref:Chromosome segregation in meiosis protein n=1 Tax=Rhinocladiella mackenziei CBS 650.93 TaxID=1442369 RepID=A0A0D2FKU1_9EURO|nr:uncharacterized protein Z518_08473 [Rhinocladiella mackenziei CBS 650.93]KIX02532.1 hypothetical protein Z518_08473 [Rhinocladiella mackenziei CBS 650.93]